MGTETVLSNIVRVGFVTAVDAVRRRARVYFEDMGFTSDWLYVLQHYDADVHVEPDNEHDHYGNVPMIQKHDHPRTYLEYWMPKVDDRVWCLYVPVENGDGIVLGGM